MSAGTAEAPRRDPVRVFGEMAVGFVGGTALVVLSAAVVAVVAYAVGSASYSGPDSFMAGFMAAVGSAFAAGCWCWVVLLPAAAVALVAGRGGLALGLILAGVVPAMFTTTCAVPLVAGAL
jgi:hypothetical protein